jgi:hypothetical protein
VLVLGASAADVVIGLHVLGAVVGFGTLFVFPVLFAVATRVDPHVMPWLLRARVRAGRILVNPGLTLVVAAGIFLATDEHYWKSFFVAWGIAAALIIGGVEGAIVIRRATRLAMIAERDLAATSVPGGGQRRSATWSDEYIRGWRVLAAFDRLQGLVVLVTIFLMATHA